MHCLKPIERDTPKLIGKNMVIKAVRGIVDTKKDPETGKHIYKFKRDPESFVYKQQNKLRDTEEGRYQLKLQTIQIIWG